MGKTKYTPSLKTKPGVCQYLLCILNMKKHVKGLLIEMKRLNPKAGLYEVSVEPRNQVTQTRTNSFLCKSPLGQKYPQPQRTVLLENNLLGQENM